MPQSPLHVVETLGVGVEGMNCVLFQLVWKDSVKVGLAISISPQYGIIVVARWHPGGNIGFLDDYVRNVAPKGERTV